ncbi:secretin receptor-like [Galendromus occidentalis]|uniref:Secretin receptor-like n=1 Tax=Galendromus occidentalis TaxID=34638 RepID=A0AAJ6VVD4_9ACAR|nr:secretin receptor-like [Galendromus occidentalis]
MPKGCLTELTNSKNPRSEKCDQIVDERLALPSSSWCNLTDDMRGNCPADWDGSLCWRSASPGETLNQTCPSKVKQYSSHKSVSRTCSAEGQWSPPNYFTCFNDAHLEYIRVMTKYLRSIKRVSFIGYSTSLILLIAAFILLVSLKRLRCPRNKLHLHLFASFMLRSLIVVTKFLVFPTGVQSFGSDYTGCRIFMVVFHYTLAANYCWILMEGLYLYNLIFMSVYKDNSKITSYVLMGWGFPMPSVIIWTIVNAIMDNEDCWVTGPPAVTWIHRGPITFSIVLNFFFFLRITRVVFLKVSSATAVQESHNRNIRYRKWFRSTLVLVPLFGVHYTVLFIVSLVDDDIVQIYWLYIDQIFSSFQGSVVALLYCFFNNEVQSEVIRILPQGLKSKMSFLKRSATYESSANYSKRDSTSHRTFTTKSRFFERRQLLHRDSANQYTAKEELEHTCLCSIENSPPSRGTCFFDRVPASLDMPKEPNLIESGV